MKKLFTYLLAIFLFSLTTPVVAQTKLEEVRIAQFGKAKFLLYLPLYIAMEEGFFAKQGLKVALNYAGNDDQVFATLVSGSADFAVGDPVFTAIAAEQGFEAKTVALLIRKLAIFGYTNKSNIEQISSVQQLANLRIGSFPAPSTTYTLLSEMGKALPKDKVLRIVEGAIGTQLALLRADMVDIAVDLEPTVSIVESQGDRVVLDMASLSEPQAITGLMTTSKLIKEHPDKVARVVAAIAEALSSLQKSRELAYRTAHKVFPEIQEKILVRAVDRVIDSGCYPLTPSIRDEDWQRTLRTRIESGELKSSQETIKAVDNQFASKFIQP